MDFHFTWPYERVMGDNYIEVCPFCKAEGVLIHMKKEAVENAYEGFKTHVVMPCCHENLTIVQMDDDYIWSDRPLR
jgi:hypothetical protein